MKRIPLFVALLTGLIFVGGCASEGARASAGAQGAPTQREKAAAQQPAPATGQQQTAAAPADKAETKVILPPGFSKPPAPFEGEGWESLFDGQTLTGWRETQFAGHGEVQCQAGALILNMGDPFTGINYTNEFPKINYEVALDAMRVMGSDFFCGLTVPVGESFCSLIVGGWGGGLVGISSLNGMDASENETTKFMSFELGRWYRIRLRVTEDRIEGWIDNEKLINADTKEKRISLRPGDIELSKPFGLAAWQTTAALRQMKVRSVDKPAGPARAF